MRGRATRSGTVLLMWEHGCAHSPIWSRSDDLDTGPIDARDLGLDDRLREDLAVWNRGYERAFDLDEAGEAEPVGHDAARAVRSFLLAARIQRGLGDGWTVWCLAGGGDGGLRDAGAFGSLRRTSGPHIVLQDGGPVDWTPCGVVPAIGRFGEPLRRDVRAWRGSSAHLPPAEHRARALELAGRLQEALPDGRVLWFGGGNVPG